MLLAAAVAGYAWSGAPWWAFLVLLLAPDLSMIGYLRGPIAGSVTYNAVHTTSVPGLLLLTTLAAGQAAPAPYLLIWLAHIGLDRAVGYGLKLPSGFQDTHLGRMGAASSEPHPHA